MGINMELIERENRIGRLEAENAALRADAERYAYLRHSSRRECLDLTGPEAGVWCDCEDANGTLQLLTDQDLDAAIDTARGVR